MLQVLWNRHYQKYWSALSGYHWSPDLRLLVDDLTARLRTKVVDLISRAYATIAVPKFAAFIGMKEEEAIRSEFWLNGTSFLLSTAY